MTIEDEKFAVKDSGVREQFKSGMVRDTEDGKVDFYRVFEGPMLERWAAHLTKGAHKYPDWLPGTANWTLAGGREELIRFKKSAARHFIQWVRGDTDEDHAAAVIFNLNGAEYVKGRMEDGLKATTKSSQGGPEQEGRLAWAGINYSSDSAGQVVARFQTIPQGD